MSKYLVKWKIGQYSGEEEIEADNAEDANAYAWEIAQEEANNMMSADATLIEEDEETET